MSEYLNLFKVTGEAGEDTGNDMSHHDYVSGYALCAVNLDHTAQ